MENKLAESVRRPAPRPIMIEAPTVVPFSIHSPVRHVRSRPILIDAAACFIATAMGSLSPQALSLMDLAPPKSVVANVDPESGKFIDRILVGGLQPLSWEESEVASAPAFTTVPPLPAGEARAYAAPQKAAPLKAKDAVVKKPEKLVASRTPDAAQIPAAAAPHPDMDALATETKPEPSEQGVLAALTPASLSAKLVPVGQKVWGGAKSVGGAVSSGLSWLGY